MSKLNIDQKTIKDLLSDKHADFLIPDYQRPYAWTEDECQTLWDDMFEFAFPGNNSENFDAANDEYYLGSIVTFRNGDRKQEVIDGQQRLTTLLLLLRAFYDKFALMKDSQSKRTFETISRCVWKTDEFGDPKKDNLKINSEVASDSDKEEFLRILNQGDLGSGPMKSVYAKNFKFFQNKISTLVNEYPSYTSLFANRILNNVILLPIEAESQDTALRIFSTLNDRGLPLSDADIFKSQFYKYFASIGKKENFIERWKKLEEIASTVFSGGRGVPLDELFVRYMYFVRAKQGNKDNTTKGLREFYSVNNYEILKNEETLQNLEKLAQFWQKVFIQDRGFSEEVLKRLWVLNYAPNGMWAYLTTVYFLANRDEQGNLNQEKFASFLEKITAFIFLTPFIPRA